MYGHLGEDTWIKHLWKFLFDTGIQLDDTTSDFKMVREGDSPLSKQFAEAFMQKKITRAEWKKANLCRIYLKVLSVGDIASGDGRSIDGRIHKGKLLLSRARNIDWPVQGRPKQTDWYIWNKVLKTSLLNSAGYLTHPVGRWLPNLENIYCKRWEWWVDQETNYLYRFINDKLLKFTSTH